MSERDDLDTRYSEDFEDLEGEWGALEGDEDIPAGVECACAICGGEVYALGVLGRKAWGRCRACGTEVAVDLYDGAGY